MIWIINNISVLMRYTVMHIQLSIMPILVGAIVAIPLGWIINHAGKWRNLCLNIVGAWYVVPSLPLLVVLPSLLDTKILDPINLEIVLSLYAIALMTQYGADSLRIADNNMLLGARAVGFTASQIFFHVQLPQAYRVLISGLRVVAVSTISLVTIGSLIGIPSVGTLFIEGYQRAFPTEIITAIVLVMIIALITDELLVLLNRILTPWDHISRNISLYNMIFRKILKKPSLKTS